MPKPEEDARRKIDAALAAAGWTLQDRNAVNLYASQGVAVREFPLTTGHADYLLFVDGKAAGVVEAKKEGMTLTGVEPQTRKYSAGLPGHLRPAWDPLPFLYRSNGGETFFTNLLEPEPRSRPLFDANFHRPETLAGWLAPAQEIPAGHPLHGRPAPLRARLHHLPELTTAGLWSAQHQAVTKLEESLQDNRPRSLIQMATGSGKTFTAITAAYRLIKFAGARRVLFLVDRSNLGRQALKEFQQYTTPDDGRKFTELYNVQHLTSNKLDSVSRVVICTIQRPYSLLKGEEIVPNLAELEERSLYSLEGMVREPVPVVYNPYLPLETFDVVIVDECHRSIYTLWRQVVEYFDAFLVGLTATPSAQTIGFFGKNLVMEYGHSQAVADRVNVDYTVYRIRTRITEQGSSIEASSFVDYRDRRTRAVRWQALDDDVTYAPQVLDRDVVAVDQIRIAAALEQSLSRIDSAVASLQRVQANLRRYRAAVLKAACNGSLICSRREHSPQVPDPLVSELWKLPPGWRWVKADDVSEFITKGTTPAAEFLHPKSGEIPFIKVYNLTFTGALDFSKDPTFVSRQVHESELKRSIVRPGDVLMNIVGPPLGKVSVVPAAHAEWNINQAIARYRPLRGLEPRFLSLVLQNREIIRWAVSRSKATAGQFNLTLETARQIPIPLPPEEQQSLIITEVERRLSIMESVTSTIVDNLQKAQNLRKTILTNAFQGRLVLQDPNDEPASILLERIRQAKASQPSEPRARKERTKPVPALPPFPPPPLLLEEPPSVPKPERPLVGNFLELPRGEQMDTVWELLFGEGIVEKSAAIRSVADQLQGLDLARFKRLRQDSPLYGTIAAAIERCVREGSFDRPRRGCLRAVLSDPKEYTDEVWQQCVLAVTGDEPAEIEDTLRAAAEWARETMGLEFVRLREGGVILTGLREALKDEVRAGRIVRRGGKIRKALA